MGQVLAATLASFVVLVISLFPPPLLVVLFLFENNCCALFMPSCISFRRAPNRPSVSGIGAPLVTYRWGLLGIHGQQYFNIDLPWLSANDIRGSHDWSIITEPKPTLYHNYRSLASEGDDSDRVFPISFTNKGARITQATTANAAQEYDGATVSNIDGKLKQQVQALHFMDKSNGIKWSSPSKGAKSATSIVVTSTEITLHMSSKNSQY